jgi:hypothetical protein
MTALLVFLVVTVVGLAAGSVWQALAGRNGARTSLRENGLLWFALVGVGAVLGGVAVAGALGLVQPSSDLQALDSYRVRGEEAGALINQDEPAGEGVTEQICRQHYDALVDPPAGAAPGSPWNSDDVYRWSLQQKYYLQGCLSMRVESSPSSGASPTPTPITAPVRTRASSGR